MASIFTAQYEPVDTNRIREDLIKSTEAHQAIEDSYGELSLAVSQLDKMLDLNADKGLIEIQKNYINNLKNQVDVLSNQGLNPNTRKALIGARDRYASEIVPIQDAIARRKEAMTAQQKKAAEDPDIRFDEYASNKSVTDFYNNPTLDVISNNYSGKEIRSIVAAEAANLKNWIERDGIGALKSLGLPYQYQQMLRKGYSPEEVMRAAMADPAASTKLLSVIDRAIQSTGISKWKSAGDNFGFGTGNELYNWAWNAGAPGLYNAVGTSELKTYTDNYSADLDAYRKKKAMDKPEGSPRVEFGDLVTSGVVSPETINKYFNIDPVTGRMTLKKSITSVKIGGKVQPNDIFIVDEKTGKVKIGSAEEIKNKLEKRKKDRSSADNWHNLGIDDSLHENSLIEEAEELRTVLGALGIDVDQSNLFRYKDGEIILGTNSKSRETLNDVATRNYNTSSSIGYTKRGTIDISLDNTASDAILRKMKRNRTGVREITGLNKDYSFKVGDTVELGEGDINVLAVKNFPLSNTQYAQIEIKKDKDSKSKIINVTLPPGVFGGNSALLSSYNAALIKASDIGDFETVNNYTQAINNLLYQGTVTEAAHHNTSKDVFK